MTHALTRRFWPTDNGWRLPHYVVFRGLLGAYLAIHFAMLVPWGAELFSRFGMLPDAALSPFTGAVPNPLAHYDAPEAIAGVLIASVAASVLLGLGLFDRVAAVFLWLVLAFLFQRNPLIANPSLPYVGWLLLAHTLVPRVPSVFRVGRAGEAATSWCLPQALHLSAWAVMAAGYTYSGVTKLASPSWRDGSAFRHVLENPLAHPTILRDALLALPEALLAVASYGALALEVAFVGLALSRRLRPALWLAMVGMHLGLLVLIDFADLTLGMLVLHAFTFDPAWLAAPRTEWAKSRPVRRRLAASLAVAGMAWLALPPGAEAREEPVPAIEAPAPKLGSVVITNDGIRHAGLVIEGRDGPVEYAYGDLDWFALGQTQLWRAPRTLLLPSQAVFSRRPLPATELARLGREQGFLCRRYEVPVDAIAELEADLARRFVPAAVEALIWNERHGMEFVLAKRRYSILFNCHDQVAKWLRRMGVRTWPLPLRVKAPRSMQPCQEVVAAG